MWWYILIILSIALPIYIYQASNRILRELATAAQELHDQFEYLNEDTESTAAPSPSSSSFSSFSSQQTGHALSPTLRALNCHTLPGRLNELMHVQPVLQTIHYPTTSDSAYHGVAELLTIPTTVVQREESNTPKLVFLMIPGNPGLVFFYRTLLFCLKKLTEVEKITVEYRCLSHFGHTSSRQSINDAHEPFSIDMQVLFFRQQFKQMMINDPPGTKYILAGHSIGAHVCLKLLTEYSASILHVYKLCPTIYGMKNSPNGQQLKYALHPYMTYIRQGVVSLLSLLPHRLKIYLVSLHIPTQYVWEFDSVLYLLSTHLSRQAFHMGHTEVETVNDLPKEEIKSVQDKITYLWAYQDDWAPLSYYIELQQFYEKEVDHQPHPYRSSFHIAPHDVKHAFVLGSNQSVAHIVAEWVKQDYYLFRNKW